MRTCIGCRRRTTTDQLERIVRRPDGSVGFSRTRPGRGAWVCVGSPDCVEAATSGRRLGRALRAPVLLADAQRLRADARACARMGAALEPAGGMTRDERTMRG